MKDIRVVHDRCGVYADWFADDNNDPSIQEQWLVKYHDRYFTGQLPPNYPVPAIPLAVKYDYVGCINIDDVSDPDDPIIVYMFDSWNVECPECRELGYYLNCKTHN